MPCPWVGLGGPEQYLCPPPGPVVRSGYTRFSTPRGLAGQLIGQPYLSIQHVRSRWLLYGCSFGVVELHRRSDLFFFFVDAIL
jgi:hypothetical protein